MIVLYRAPRHFWVSEVCYAVLSLTSKGILGVILMSNLIAQNARDASV